MAKIINIEIIERLAHVTYDTGTEKVYSTEKLPKTVQTWLKRNEEPEEKVISDTIVNVPEIRKLPEIVEEAKPAEKPTVGPGAAEAVAFGVSLALVIAIQAMFCLVMLLIVIARTAIHNIIPVVKRGYINGYHLLRLAMRQGKAYYPVVITEGKAMAKVAARYVAIAAWYIYIMHKIQR